MHLPLVLALQGVLGAPSLCHPHDAPVPLAEICGRLLAASPLLGAPGEVAGSPSASLPGARVSSPGGLAWCPLLVPSVDRGASVSVVGGEGPRGGKQLLRFLTWLSSLHRALYSSLTMNGDQKSDPYAQAKQDFIQHFSEIVKVLTEDGVGHPETGDAIARLKEVKDW